MAPVGVNPDPPLLAIVATSVAGKPSLRPPVVRVGVPIPNMDTQRVELVYVRARGNEPEKLGEDRTKSKALGGDCRETVGHAKSHNFAEDGSSPDTSSVAAIDPAIRCFAENVQVLIFGHSGPKPGRT